MYLFFVCEFILFYLINLVILCHHPLMEMFALGQV